MRLIDADLLKQNCKCTGKFEDNFICVDLITLAKVIDNQPTAYDVEAVVAELEKLKDDDDESGCEGVSCVNCKYKESCIEGEEAYKVTLDKAISIVRGKE